MAKSLFERVEAALAPHARGADVAKVIEAVEAEIAAAIIDRDASHAAAVSPRSDDAAAEAAADAEMKATRRIVRLETQLTSLRARKVEIDESDRVKAADAAKASTLAERDALATEIRQVWPEITDRMADLFRRIVANDKRCDRHGIISSEATARGCGGCFSFSGTPIPRLINCVIPRLNASDVQSILDPFAWSPKDRG